MRFLATFFLIVLLALLPVTGFQARAQGGNMGFVQLTLNREFTIPFFETYFDKSEQPYLHFNALMTALELPIDFERSLGTASGILADGKTTFNLSLERMTVEVGKVTHRLPKDAVLLLENGLFILWTEVGKWLPIKVEWAVDSYEIRIGTQYRLPSVQRRERASERQRLLEAQEERSRMKLMDRELPLFEPGMLQLNSGARANNNGEQYELNLIGVHRFLGGDLEYSVTQRYSSEAPDELTDDYVRLKFYDDLRQNELTLGDTFTTFSPLILSSATFRGASFFTGGRLLRFGRTTIIGTAPADSEVDLYRLGILVSFTRADESGFYRFENVPLSHSSTLFEVRIFTPRGRRYSEFKLVSSQEEMVADGKVAAQGGTGSSIQESNPFSLSGGEFRYGLTEGITLGAYGLKLEDFRTRSGDIIDEMEAVGLFGMGRPVDWFILLVERSQDSVLSGSANRLAGFFSFSKASVDIERHDYDGEFSPPARRRATEFGGLHLLLNLTKIVTRTRFFAINTNLAARQFDFGNSRKLEEREARFDRRFIDKLSIILALQQEEFSDSTGVVTGNDTIELTSNYRLGLLTRIEGQLKRVSPVTGESVSQERVTFRKIQQLDAPLGFQVSYTANSNNDDVAALSLSYLFSNSIRASGSADTEGNWDVSVRYSLTFRVSGSGVQTLPTRMFGRAGVEGMVFMDEDGDGIRGPEEEAMPDVRIVAPGIRDLITDEEGRYAGWGLPTTSPVTVGVDLLTTDALFVPLREKQLLAMRPGELMRLDIPLVPSGGLSGFLNTKVARTISPANGVVMRLETEEGVRVATVQVEWDGTFIIEGIPPGDYVLLGDPEDLAARGLELAPERRKLKFPPGPEPAWMEDVEFSIRKRGGGSLPGPQDRIKRESRQAPSQGAGS